MKLSKIILCFSLALALLGFGGAGAAKAGTEMRAFYPVMTTAKLDKLLATQGKGKVALVSIFASWCPPCRKEIPQLVHLRSKVSEQEMLIIGLSVDEDLTELQRFLSRCRINFPVYTATQGIAERYSIEAIPRLLVFDAKGKLIRDIEGALNDAGFNALVDYLLENAYE